MIVLKEDFTKEQCELAQKLKLELEESCHELEEFSDVQVYGLDIKEDNENSILFSVAYGEPENDGNITIFPCY